MIKNLKNTEEVKPGIFVQKKGQRYRVVNPAFWNGKFRFKEQLRASFRSFISLAIILFLIWAYIHDTQGLKEFYYEFQEDPAQFCVNNVQLNVFGNPDGDNRILRKFNITNPNISA